MTSLPSTIEIPARLPFWRRPVRVIRENARAYLIINVATYGLALIGFLIGLAFPALNTAQVAGLEDDGTGSLVRQLVFTPPLFALLILGVNVFRLSLLTIVLPSLVVPFAGLAFFGYWVVETGIVLAPASPTGWVALIPHSLTLVIELQAYVLLGPRGVPPRKELAVPSQRRGAESSQGIPSGAEAARCSRHSCARAAHRGRALGGVFDSVFRGPSHSAASLVDLAGPAEADVAPLKVL